MGKILQGLNSMCWGVASDNRYYGQAVCVCVCVCVSVCVCVCLCLCLCVYLRDE